MCGHYGWLASKVLENVEGARTTHSVVAFENEEINRSTCKRQAVTNTGTLFSLLKG